MFKLGVIIGYGGSSVQTLAKAAQTLREEGFDIEVRAATEKSKIDWHGFTHWLIEEADALLIKVPSGLDSYDKIISYSRMNTIVSLTEPEKSRVSKKDIAILDQYHKYGGKENLKNLILYMGNLAGYKYCPKEPKSVLWQGIYHPDLGVYEKKEDYIADYKKRGLNPSVGILFYRSHWLDGNCLVVDSLIKELESRNIGVLPVFSYGFGDKSRGIPGNLEALEKLKDCKLLINLHSFFLLPQRTFPLSTPVLQGVKEYYKTEDEWREDPQGIGPLAQVINIAQPEYDGMIEPVLVGARRDVVDSSIKGSYQMLQPVCDRIKYMIGRVEGWLHLQKKPKKKRRITFVLHNAPCKGAEATVGRGGGLDTLESVIRVMRELKADGYSVCDIPETGNDLAQLILKKKAISEFRWTTVQDIVRCGGALELIEEEKYIGWFEALPITAREKVLKGWGDPPGPGMAYDGKLVVTGLNFGNVNVLVQPKRGCYGSTCDGKVCKILHDPNIAPTHHWIATYKWIQENSEAIVHVGTHGYLEFLPGKSAGLAGEDFPEISIGNKPHFYIYTMANPMEGVTAKRRSYATLVDHLTPAMTSSGLHDELEDIENLLNQYNNASSLNENARAEVLKENIIRTALRVLSSDFNGTSEEEFNRFVQDLHKQITLLKDTMIRDGLHILSQPPAGEKLANTLVSVLRFDGSVPSIRRVILEVEGFNYEDIIQNPEKTMGPSGSLSYGQVLDATTKKAARLMEASIEGGDLEEIIYETLSVKRKEKVIELISVIQYGLKVADQIMACEREIPQLLRGINGEFIEPGASGSITRGNTDVLPTGRNFYILDPRKIPTKAAWSIGKGLAEKLLEKYLKEEGVYPETVGMVLWSIDAFRADGEEICQILYLMGARPCWDQKGKITNIEIIPLEELGRPRIDVVMRLSGIFRDTLPNIYELMDDAVQKIMELDEPAEMNFLRKHLMEVSTHINEKKARHRIFAAQPGSYGAGVNYAVEASAWETEDDLRDVYVNSGGYSYGRNVYGEPAHESFALSLKKVNLTYNKLESDEHDPLDCCCFFAYQGGMASAAKSLSGKEVKSFWGDTRNPKQPGIRDMKEEIERVVRTKLLNPRWLKGQKEHGYKGAGDISSRVLHTYGWDATCQIVDDWVYNEIQDRIVMGMKDWFMEQNPYALEEIMRRLLEANERGLWNAQEEALTELKEMYLEFEGLMEDEPREGHFQGGNIDIKTAKDVES